MMEEVRLLNYYQVTMNYCFVLMFGLSFSISLTCKSYALSSSILKFEVFITVNIITVTAPLFAELYLDFLISGM